MLMLAPLPVRDAASAYTIAVEWVAAGVNDGQLAESLQYVHAAVVGLLRPLER